MLERDYRQKKNYVQTNKIDYTKIADSIQAVRSLKTHYIPTTDKLHNTQIPQLGRGKNRLRYKLQADYII